ncbi:hypothetical protein GWI33_008952 [Rhynchophorus ferrugineus]|uniref:Uncharacterized protein n=1 Tax=Rhynchophorus ferrugineus TaxID=354439 RepID=A0A834IHL7_RHYFE|nr:hypothetical protein GWI33_008952 [Rhynchophorus ferrugineus]
MATEVENNVPVTETKEIKEEKETPKVEEAKKEEAAAGEAPKEKEKEPAPPKVVVHKTNYEKDVTYLYQFSRTPLLPSMSPYCLKVESWLRLAGIKYEVGPSLIISASTRRFSRFPASVRVKTEINIDFIHEMLDKAVRARHLAVIVLLIYSRFVESAMFAFSRVRI